MKIIKTIIIVLMLMFSSSLFSAHLLVPMDKSQKNHLRAYGLTFWVLKLGLKARWLLNYKGGSFILPDLASIRKKALIFGV